MFADDQLTMYINHLLEWHCCIDDVFAVWGGPEALLQQFLIELNNNDFKLKFTMHYD